MTNVTIITGADRDSLYLTHHGIKGQKWGVRRFQDLKGKLTAIGKKRQEANEKKKAAKAEKKAAKAKLKQERKTDTAALINKSSKTMSNEELKKAIARMELENKYRDTAKKYNSAEIEKDKAKEARVNKFKDKMAEKGSTIAANLVGNIAAGTTAKVLNGIMGGDFISKEELLTGNFKVKKEDTTKTQTENVDVSKLTNAELKAYNQRLNDEATAYRNKNDLEKQRNGNKNDKKTDISDGDVANKSDAELKDYATRVQTELNSIKKSNELAEERKKQEELRKQKENLNHSDALGNIFRPAVFDLDTAITLSEEMLNHSESSINLFDPATFDLDTAIAVSEENQNGQKNVFLAQSDELQEDENDDWFETEEFIEAEEFIRAMCQ